MDKNKMFSLAVIILSISIVSSSIIIFLGLQSFSNAINTMKKNEEIKSKEEAKNAEIMKLEDAAKYLHISEEKLTEIVKNQNPTIPYIWIDNKYLFSKTALDLWASRQLGVTGY